MSILAASKYLLVVRYPTGGIRTHIKYVRELAPFDADAPAPILICPDDAEGRAVACVLNLGRAEFAAPGARNAFDLAVATMKSALRFRPKVIHSHGFSSAISAAPTAFFGLRRHIITVHDVVTPGLIAAMPRLTTYLLGLVLRSAYAVHAVGADCATSLRQLPFLRRAKNIVTIPNGINTAQFAQVKPRPIRSELSLGADVMLVGFFGRFMAQKGFRTLIDAIACINDGPSAGTIHVLAVGNGGFIREDRAYIASRGLEHYFHFFDAVENPAALMAGVNAVVMPSRWEAYPLLAAEALTLGVPLIASTCIGLREVTQGSPAATFPPDDSALLAQILLAEYAQPSCSAAREYAPIAAARFDVRNSAARIQALLISATQGMRLPESDTPSDTNTV